MIWTESNNNIVGSRPENLLNSFLFEYSQAKSRAKPQEA